MLFRHDCEHCVFLGVFETADLYYCLEQGDTPTVLARFSDEGSDYKSGLMFAERDKHLGEALRLARQRKLVA